MKKETTTTFVFYFIVLTRLTRHVLTNNSSLVICNFSRVAVIPHKLLDEKLYGSLKM